MKRNNKEGFTVVEMIAVIVILLIIIILTVPVVGNIIETVRKNAFKATASGIINASKHIWDLDNESQEYYYYNGIEYNGDNKVLKYSGTKPKTGVVIIDEVGKVAIGIHDGTYCATKPSDKKGVMVEKVTVDQCSIYFTVSTCDSWETIASRYDVALSDLLALNNEIDSNSSTCDRDIKVPVSPIFAGDQLVSSEGGDLDVNYKTYYSIGYTGYSDSFTSTNYAYTIELGILPLSIGDINNVTVTASSVFEELDDFKRYILKKQMGEVVWPIGEDINLNIDQALIFKNHAVTSNNMDVNDITVNCNAITCYADISITVNNMDGIVPNTINESEIVYLPVKFMVEFNGEEVASNYNAVKGVNRPLLSAGMVPIKWDGSTWITTSESDADWYNYTTTDKKWANAQTADGSMWVWVPRYIYKISSGWHTNTVGTIDVQFSIGTDDSIGGAVSIVNTGGANDSNGTWTNHPAFTFGDTELTGIWIAKFEPSGTVDAIEIKPNATSLRNVAVGDAFTAARNMEISNRYGWGTTGTGIDSHLAKNVEWGAAVYLTQSTYGKNAEVALNTSGVYEDYVTGCAGSEASGFFVEHDYDGDGCEFSYEQAGGQQASTTGNIYGIYDMNGGTCGEYLSAFISNGNLNLSTYGSSIMSADTKYKDIYAMGATDTVTNNYALTINKKGDALYEISLDGWAYNQGTDYTATGWYGDISLMGSDNWTWLTRSQNFGSEYSEVGIFAFSSMTGIATDYTSFRVTLLVAPGL